MEPLFDVASWIFLVLGSVFCIIGGIGMLRLPDFYTRSHAASLTDTLGAALILMGLGLQSGLGLITVKLIFILIFLFITSPTSAHALAKSAFFHGVHGPAIEDMREAAPRGGADA